MKGEITIVKVSSGQTYFISDMIWVFSVLNNYVYSKVNVLDGRPLVEYDAIKNIHYMRYDSIKSTEFMDDLKLADAQQSEILFDILKNRTSLFINYEDNWQNLIVIRSIFEPSDELKKSVRSTIIFFTNIL